MGNTATLSDGWYYIKNVNTKKYRQVANNINKIVRKRFEKK